jgi:hypothetical protein
MNAIQRPRAQLDGDAQDLRAAADEPAHAPRVLADAHDADLTYHLQGRGPASSVPTTSFLWLFRSRTRGSGRCRRFEQANHARPRMATRRGPPT